MEVAIEAVPDAAHVLRDHPTKRSRAGLRPLLLAALAAVRSFEPDIVLLDLGLPDMDGYEIARSAQAR